MSSGLCYQCGPSGAKTLKSPKQIKQVRMFTDNDGRIVYLCKPCARELGYIVEKTHVIRGTRVTHTFGPLENAK